MLLAEGGEVPGRAGRPTRGEPAEARWRPHAGRRSAGAATPGGRGVAARTGGARDPPRTRRLAYRSAASSRLCAPLERLGVAGQRLAELGRLGDEVPRPTAELVALKPERLLSLPRLAPSPRLRPLALAESLDRAREDTVLLLAERVNLPEVFGGHCLQLVPEERLHLVRDSRVGVAVVSPDLCRQVAGGLHQRCRQRRGSRRSSLAMGGRVEGRGRTRRTGPSPRADGAGGRGALPSRSPG